MALELKELSDALPDGNAPPPTQTTSNTPSVVLFLGDGDFSFAAAHAELYPEDRLHVTEVLTEQKWQDTFRNTTRRRADLEYAGSTIKFCVSAIDTDLVQHKDIIYFMFPFIERDREGTVALVHDAMANILKKATLETKVYLGLA